MAHTSTSMQNPNKENSCPNAQGKLTQRQPRQALQSCDPNTQTSDDSCNSRSEVEINALESHIHELEVAQLGNLSSQDVAPAPNESIDRPRRASKVSMQQIRQDLGYDKTWWNSFRTYCCDAATSTCLNWGENWKSQQSDKLLKSYNVFWDNHKTYQSCVNNESTYRGRQVTTRCAAHAATSPRTSSPPARTSPISISPTPGPLHPRCCLPINSDDDDNNDGQGEDVFQPASDEDTEHNGGDEGEDENEMSEKAKGKHEAKIHGIL
ncbi:hypothetical protein DFH08DRAFT_797966 [Mycena albidolilacea]|uniref:Uncharacterized protein n=1 Tax=Mycena albidolilacea TaxID=1033008 RepID=A0AAD7ASF7_9AGAR|nr:hypothetical protein DFH08DRAFT_797966 [Mycena albidolilacea]